MRIKQHALFRLPQHYGHREKLRLIGREADLEKLNLEALRIAREVADETGTLVAGNLCNSAVYQRDHPQAIQEAEQIFKVGGPVGTTQTGTQTGTQTQTHAHTHTHTNTRTRAGTHTHTRAHTNTPVSYTHLTLPTRSLV